MKKSILSTLVVLAFVVFSATTQAQSKTIVDVAVGSSDHTTLVAALKAADLVKTLQGAGPFTVFAPTNEAFNKLPEGAVASLLKVESKAMLTSVLTYHVIAGKLMAKDVVSAIGKGKGKAVLTTIQGGKLTATLDGSKVKLTDEKGGSAYVILADLSADNGVIHVIDSVIMPK